MDKKLFLSVFSGLFFGLLFLAAPVHGARTKTDIPGMEKIIERQSSPLVERIQKALTESGLYKGPTDGVMNGQTEDAIRAYQKGASLKVDGQVSEALAERLETGVKIEDLLGRLERTRQRNIDAARKALLSTPATRDLVSGEDSDDAIANPVRDTTACLESPSPDCLLNEASESAKAVFKPQMRDWALVEVLVAEAKAGLSEKARVTMRRISDPRLIMVALRDIAEAQAETGHTNDALQAAGIIPNVAKRIEALILIAKSQKDRDDIGGARKTSFQILDTLNDVNDPLKRVSFLAQIIVVLHEIGETEVSKKSLKEAEGLARSPELSGRADIALRHLAEALAKTKRYDQALALTKEMKDSSQATPVLVTTATLQALSGNNEDALKIAKAIDVPRYRAAVLGKIALSLAQLKDPDKADETLKSALEAIEEIDLPYARSYAQGQIALAFSEISKHGKTSAFDQAIRITSQIKDERLRAQMLWSITVDHDLGGEEGNTRAKDMAAEATALVKSRLGRAWMLGNIALNYAAAGKNKDAWGAFQKGLQVAETIHNAWERARAFARLATVLVDMPEPLSAP
jgi:peptidoglycan hydrolase-like protein with peptidoglycan-binding domain